MGISNSEFSISLSLEKLFTLSLAAPMGSTLLYKSNALHYLTFHGKKCFTNTNK